MIRFIVPRRLTSEVFCLFLVYGFQPLKVGTVHQGATPRNLRQQVSGPVERFNVQVAPARRERVTVTAPWLLAQIQLKVHAER